MAGKEIDLGDRIECPCCSRRGCDECNKTGTIVITEKPTVDLATQEVILYADWLEKGMPPVQGGILDQDRWFIEAATFVLGERQALKAEALNGSERI